MIHRRIEMIAIILAIITISWSWPWEKTRAIELVKAGENKIIEIKIKLIEDKITKIKGWGAQDSVDNILLISFEFSTDSGDYGWFYEVKFIPGLKETTGQVGVYKTVVGDKILMDKYNIVRRDDYINDFVLSEWQIIRDWGLKGTSLSTYKGTSLPTYSERLNTLGRKIK